MHILGVRVETAVAIPYNCVTDLVWRQRIQTFVLYKRNSMDQRRDKIRNAVDVYTGYYL